MAGEIFVIVNRDFKCGKVISGGCGAVDESGLTGSEGGDVAGDPVHGLRFAIGYMARWGVVLLRRDDEEFAGGAEVKKGGVGLCPVAVAMVDNENDARLLGDGFVADLFLLGVDERRDKDSSATYGFVPFA